MFLDFIERDAPPYVREVMDEHLRARLTRLRQPDQPNRAKEPVVISVVKNEKERLADSSVSPVSARPMRFALGGQPGVSIAGGALRRAGWCRLEDSNL